MSTAAFPVARSAHAAKIYRPAGGALRTLLRRLSWLLLAVATAVSAADTGQRWVNDQLRVDMRSGPSFENRIIDFLPSGTPLTVLETGEDWIRVRARDKDGWIQAQYTTTSPIAADRLKQAQTELTRLRGERQSLAEELALVREQAALSASAHAEAAAELEQLRSELERIRVVSAGALETEAALARLEDEAGAMRRRLEALSLQNAALAADNRNEGLQWGAAAVLLGGLLVLLAFALGGRRRRSEWA